MVLELLELFKVGSKPSRTSVGETEALEAGKLDHV